MTSIGLSLAALAAATAAAQSPPPLAPAAAPAYESITAADLGRIIEILASDEFEGREPGSPGEERTIDYLAKAFAAAGAGPGVGRGYFQDVPLKEIRRAGDQRLAWVKGETPTALTPGADFVTYAGGARANVEIAGAEIVFAGYGIDAPEEAWNDYDGVDVRGKLVVLLKGEPGTADDSEFFDGLALTSHGMQPTKVETAAAHGAIGVISVHIEASAGYPWSVIAGGGVSATQQFIDERGGTKTQPDVVIQLSEGAARALFASSGLDLDAEIAAAGRRGFRAKRLDVAANAAYAGAERRIRSKNVIARIEGSEAPDECVLYTAHWDHVGRNPSLEGDQIFNGAVDNATGTAALIELAEAYSKLPAPPRRSVYFVATTAEEKGLLGAEYLARHPICPLAKTVAVFNLDALFPFGSFDALTVTGFGASELEDLLATAAARLGRVLQDDSQPQAGAYFRSDHYPFAKRGVPAVFAVGGPRSETMTDDNPVTAKFIDYGTNKYHKPTDEYDAATWDLKGVEEDVRIYFEAGLAASDGDRFPNWRDGNEFRPLRDAMMLGK